MWKIIRVFGFAALIFFTTHLCVADSNQQDKYEAAPGLIDLRSTLSDEAHTVEELVQMARSPNHFRAFRGSINFDELVKSHL